MSDAPPRIDPAAVRSAQFQGSFRKYDSKAVDQYLAALADQLVKVNGYIDELERQVASAPRLAARAAEPEPAPDRIVASPAEKPDLRTLSDDEIATLVGEETAHVLATARKAAEDIRTKAEEAAARLIRESTDEASSVVDAARAEAGELRREAEQVRDVAVAKADTEAREIRDKAEADADRRVAEARAMADDELVRAERLRAEADAEAEQVRSQARDDGRAMLAEAKDVRTRVLEDLQRRRDIGRAQIERLVVGRDRLLEAYAAVRENVDEMTAELEHVLDEPFDHDPALEEGFVGIVATAAPEPALAVAEPEAAVEESIEPGDAERQTEDTGAEDTGPEDTGAEDDSDDEGDTDAGVDATSTDEVEPEAQPDSEAAAASDVPGDDADGDVDVDELFARMRAGREESVARAQAVLSAAEAEDTETVVAETAADETAADEGADEDDEAPASTDVDSVAAAYLAAGEDYEHRGEVLAEATKSLSRSLKRLLADEQNDVLDAVRRTESTALDEVLPAVDAHIASYAEAASAVLVEVASAAAVRVDPDVGDVDVAELAGGLGAAVVEPLRRRIERAAGDVEGDHEELDERLRSLYREWKVDHIGRLAADALVSAYAFGQVTAAPAGASLRWLIDPATGPCPDCQDNALEGGIAAGESFPTGDRRPQAHPGCSCMLAVDP